MIKGFVFFKEGKIPFVIENYRMELFSDDSLLSDFCKEYNFKDLVILKPFKAVFDKVFFHPLTVTFVDVFLFAVHYYAFTPYCS